MRFLLKFALKIMKKVWQIEEQKNEFTKKILFLTKLIGMKKSKIFRKLLKI